jgi:cyclopropane fatty-acyl-phospholipid synthase-like methyltransferase
VTAVDAAPAALARLERRAAEEGLRIQTVCADIRAFSFQPATFALVVAVTVLSHLEEAHIRDRARPIERCLVPGGKLLVEEFTTDDPGCNGVLRCSEFACLVRHYFAAGELEHLFNSLELLHDNRMRLKDATHGPEHDHGIEQFIARKPEED